MAPAGTSSFCVCLSWLKCGRIISPKRSACIQSHGASEAPAPHVLPRSPYWKHRSRWALPKRNFLLHRCTLSLLHTSTKMKSKPRLTRWLKNSELRIATHIFLSPLVTQQHSSFWIQIICLFPLWLSNELFKMCVFCAQMNNRNKTNQEGKFGLRKCGWYLEAFEKEQTSSQIFRFVAQRGMPTIKTSPGVQNEKH